MNPNSSTRRRVASNTAWLAFGQIIGRFLRVGLVILAARWLGVISFGAFSYALSLAALLSIVTDLGLNAFTTRHLASSPNIQDHYLATAFWLKVTITFFSTLTLIILSPYLTQNQSTGSLLVLAAFVFAFDSLRDFGASISRAKERMKWEALANLLTNFTIFSLGLLALTFSSNPQYLIISYIIGTFLGVLAIAWPLRSIIKAGLSVHPSLSLVKPLLFAALPFSALSVMGALMLNTDIIMIDWLIGPTGTGLYSAIQKPIQFLYLLPALFATSLFPVMSKIHATPNHFSSLLTKSIIFTLQLALPLSLGGFILATPLVNLIYGPEFLPASFSFSLLSLSLLFIFPSIILGNAVFAARQEKSLLIYSGLGIGGNILLNFILIPVFGITGCALATLLNQFFINTYLWFKFNRLTKLSVFSKLLRSFLATLIMSLVVFYLPFTGWLTLLSITLGILVYTFILWLLREPSLNDLFNLLRQNKK